MSLKCEQYRSLYRTRGFLRELLLGPRLPMKELRQRASRCLRHYPFLRDNGEPMFSQDDFGCPSIKENT